MSEWLNPKAAYKEMDDKAFEIAKRIAGEKKY